MHPKKMQMQSGARLHLLTGQELGELDRSLGGEAEGLAGAALTWAAPWL